MRRVLQNWGGAKASVSSCAGRLRKILLLAVARLLLCSPAQVLTVRAVRELVLLPPSISQSVDSLYLEK